MAYPAPRPVMLADDSETSNYWFSELLICRDFYMEKAQETETLVTSIITVCDYFNPISIQSAYLQLRYCAEPKIAHLLRIARPDLINDAAQQHDIAIARGLNALMGAADDLLHRR